MVRSLQHAQAEISATMKLGFQSILSLKSLQVRFLQVKNNIYKEPKLLELIKTQNQGKRHVYARIGKRGKLAPNYEIHITGKQTCNKED